MAELKTHSTPERLTIDYAPWATGVILIGVTLLFAAFGVYGFIGDQVSSLWWYASALGTAFAAAIFVTRERLILDAATGTLDYRKRSVFGASHRQARLTEIGSVRLAETRTTGGGSTGEGGASQVILHQISISLPGGTVTIPDAFIGGPAVPAAHKAIETWIATQRNGHPA